MIPTYVGWVLIVIGTGPLITLRSDSSIANSVEFYLVIGGGGDTCVAPPPLSSALADRSITRHAATRAILKNELENSREQSLKDDVWNMSGTALKVIWQGVFGIASAGLGMRQLRLHTRTSPKTTIARVRKKTQKHKPESKITNFALGPNSAGEGEAPLRVRGFQIGLGWVLTQTTCAPLYFATPTRTQCGFTIRALHPPATLLAELFSHCSGAHFLGSSPAAGREEQVNQHVHAVLFALHRWWPKTPNASPNPNPPGGTGMGQKSTPSRTTATTGVPGGPPTPPEARGLTDIINRVVVHASATRVRALRAVDNSHTSPCSLRAVSLLKQQPDLGLLARTAVPRCHTRTGPTRCLQAPAGDVASAVPDAAQFRLIKSWLHHIRLFLRHIQGSPTEDAAASSQRDPLRGEAQEDGGAGAGAEDSVSRVRFFEEEMRM
ncbi:hypothetical protein BJY52DRAFT_1225738 [Lactarius psammicola]|nr:hypothetical protein BJY52DRAFT_1225738 [Lactarius psammicola]